MRVSWLLVLLLAPTVGAVGPCADVVCVSAGSSRSGAGSCDQGAPTYAEATEAALVVGVADRTFVTVFSDCHRHEAPGAPRGYRELALVASAGGREASVYWFEHEAGDVSTCRVRASGPGLLESAPCPAGGPPMLPRLP